MYSSRLHAIYLLLGLFPPHTLGRVSQRKQRVLHFRTDVAPTFRPPSLFAVASRTTRTIRFDELLVFTSPFRSSSKKGLFVIPRGKLGFLRFLSLPLKSGAHLYAGYICASRKHTRNSPPSLCAPTSYVPILPAHLPDPVSLTASFADAFCRVA